MSKSLHADAKIGTQHVQIFNNIIFNVIISYFSQMWSALMLVLGDWNCTALERYDVNKTFI